MAKKDDRPKVTKIRTVTDDDVRHRKYGGFNIGAAFFGWLVATGLAALLISLLTALGSATAFTTIKDRVNIDTSSPNNSSINTTNLSDDLQTIGLIGGILVLLALSIAYYAGGYVAGRMSRFDGGRQGFGVWVIGILLTVVLAILGVIAGSSFNLLEQLNLPRIPVDEGELSSGGLITLLLVVIVTVVAAITGGKAGQGYHDKIDRTTTQNK